MFFDEISLFQSLSKAHIQTVPTYKWGYLHTMASCIERRDFTASLRLDANHKMQAYAKPSQHS